MAVFAGKGLLRKSEYQVFGRVGLYNPRTKHEDVHVVMFHALGRGVTVVTKALVRNAANVETKNVFPRG